MVSGNVCDAEKYRRDDPTPERLFLSAYLQVASVPGNAAAGWSGGLAAPDNSMEPPNAEGERTLREADRFRLPLLPRFAVSAAS